MRYVSVFRCALAGSLLALAGNSLAGPGAGTPPRRAESRVREEVETTAIHEGRATPAEKATSRKAIMGIGKAVDRVAADVEEFGTVSMSAPLLTLPTPVLEFGLEESARTYYEHARKEVAGRAFSAVAIAQSLGIDLQGAADLDQIAAARALGRALAPDSARYQELVESRQTRADNVYRSLMEEARKEPDPAQRRQKENEALVARDNILKEDISAFKPTIDPSAAAPGPALPGSGSVITQTGTTGGGSTAKPSTPASPPAAGAGAAADAPAAEAPGAETPKQETANSTGTTVNVVNSSGAPRVSADLVGATALAGTILGATGRGGTDPLATGDLTLPDLDAVKAAEAARSLQSLSNFFHSPTDAMQFADKVVMMGAVTVSVMPGWRTRKDWAGEVVMVNSYKWVPARLEVVERVVDDPNLPCRLRARIARDYDLVGPGAARGERGDFKEMLELNGGDRWIKGGGSVGGGGGSGGAGSDGSECGVWIPEPLRFKGEVVKGERPLVSGISPLMQSDTLDLASQFKRQDEFMLALAATLQATGWKAQAKVFQQYVKNQRKEVQTRSTSATVATYSRGGGVVGFQIGPRLKALAEPETRSNRSGFILERQAFPALLVYGLDAADIYPRIQCKDGRLFVWEAKIANTQRSYWQPMTYRYKGPKDWWNPFKLLWPPVWWESALKRDRVADRALDLHDSLWDAADSLKGIGPSNERREAVWHWGQEMQKQGYELIERYVGAWNDQYLPAAVQVPLGRIPLPDRPEKPAVRADIRSAQPRLRDVAVAEKAEGEPQPFSEPVEILFHGAGLDTVERIECGYDVAVVRHSPTPSATGPATEIGASSIRMEVSVSQSVVLDFRMVLKGGAGEVRAPAVTILANGQPPKLTPRSEHRAHPPVRTIATFSPVPAPPAEDAVAIEPDLALIPTRIPEPALPRR
jgi:hypothetical protein